MFAAVQSLSPRLEDSDPGFSCSSSVSSRRTILGGANSSTLHLSQLPPCPPQLRGQTPAALGPRVPSGRRAPSTMSSWSRRRPLCCRQCRRTVGRLPQSVDVLGAHQVHRRHASRGIAGLWSWMRSSQRSLARRSPRTLLQARHHGARPSLLIWPSLLQPTPLGRRPSTVTRNGHAEDIHLKQDRCRRRRLSPSKPKSPTGWWFPFRRTRIVAVFHVRPSSLCHKVPKFLPAFCPRYKYVANGS